MHLNSSFHQNEAVMIVKTMTLGTKQVCLIFDVLTSCIFKGIQYLQVLMWWCKNEFPGKYNRAKKWICFLKSVKNFLQAIGLK